MSRSILNTARKKLSMADISKNYFLQEAVYFLSLLLAVARYGMILQGHNPALYEFKTIS